MPSAADRIDFGPSRDAGSVRAFGLALLAHGLLIAALTWGVNWKRSDRSVAFEAELWSSVAQESAPTLVELPPPPLPEPAPKSQEAPPPTPNVDIALQQEKKRKLLEQQKLQAQAEAKAEKELKLKQEQAKLKAAEDVKKTEAKKRDVKEKSNSAAVEAQRNQIVAEILRKAGATGNDSAKGTAQVSSGPSATYKNRLAALFKRNIIFSNVDSIQGNPKAEVQVKVSSTGLIMSAKLSKSSGVTAWDEAVLRAVEKTERIPLDENGKVVTDFPISFGPKD